jgi:type I restriction enzyme R subunit
MDRYGREIPNEEYGTRDFERVIALRARTQAIARHLTDFLKRTGRFAKTIVFCVNQEHADEMRRALANLNSDLVKDAPDYVARVTAEKGDIGRGYLSRFQELETTTPVILTTSQLLTTGVDAPTCKNVVLARVVNSMTEFKQIIGRGTRIREDYGKLFFNIIDYTGSATTPAQQPSGLLTPPSMASLRSSTRLSSTEKAGLSRRQMLAASTVTARKANIRMIRGLCLRIRRVILAMTWMPYHGGTTLMADR